MAGRSEWDDNRDGRTDRVIDPVATLTFLAYLLIEALRNCPLGNDLFDPDQPRFQIRFTRAPT